MNFDAQTLTTLWSRLSETLQAKLDAFVGVLPAIALAALVLFAGWFLSKGAAKAIRASLSRLTSNVQVAGILSTLGRVAVLVGALFVALGILDLDKTVTSLLAGVGVVGIALGFAFQDIAANFMSGLLMAFRDEFGTGDLIKTGEYFGTVDRVTLRTTELRRPSGEIVLLPNRQVFSNPVENFTRRQQRRVDVEVGVGYGSDLAEVERVTLEAIRSVDQADHDQPIDVLFTGFGGSSIDLVARFWLDYDKPVDFLLAKSDAIRAIKAAYDEADIEIPFPIRTLQLGSERLHEALVELAPDRSESKAA